MKADILSTFKVYVRRSGDYASVVLEHRGRLPVSVVGVYVSYLSGISVFFQVFVRGVLVAHLQANMMLVVGSFI